VYNAATNGASAEAARARVEGLTDSGEIGKINTGKVVRITDFGAFVVILPGPVGMVHISQLADYRAPTVESVVKLGDEVMVMVTDVDAGGKIRLSRRAVLEGLTLSRREMDKPKVGDGGDRSRGGEIAAAATGAAVIAVAKRKSEATANHDEPLARMCEVFFLV
jgi:polyribonucleotide nucleotidyltransferase